MAKDDLGIPAPPAALRPPFVAVGRYGPSSVDAEDFSRRLGNWGSASHLIGGRWEALAPDLLRRRLPWIVPAGGGRVITVEAVLELDAHDAGAALQRAGISAPDLLLVGRLGVGASARPVLRAADCKVSLDTADVDQTAPARLQSTFEKIARGHASVADALHEQVEALPGSARATAAEAVAAALGGRWDRVLAGDGLFVAPDNGFNRWFLAQLERRRRTGQPLGRLPASGPRRAAADVSGPLDAARAERLLLPAQLETIEATTFLAGLAGWAEAQVVAGLDSVDLTGSDLSVAERCWRAGAGLHGAVLAFRRRLFTPAPAPLDGPGASRDVVPSLRRVATRRPPRDSADLVAAVAHTLDARRPLWEREAVVLRPPVAFGAWAARLNGRRANGRAIRRPDLSLDGHDGSRTAAPPGDDSTTLRQAANGPRSVRALFAEMTRRHRGRVVTAAAALYDAGETETGVLEMLESRADEWEAAALSDAGELGTLS